MVKKAEKITREARINAEQWRQTWQSNINQYHEFHDFVLGRQWTDDEEDMLNTFKKVPLQFNKLATMINNLLGEQQQNTPQLQVVPMENCGDETAEIRELVVKDLMFSSGAKTAYQVAASQAFIGGFGAFCIGTDYSYSKSFDQDIIYKYFKDATRCYWDSSAETINKTDGMYCGYLSRMSRKKFKQMYGENIESKILVDEKIFANKQEVALVSDPTANGGTFNWADNESVTIQDHYVRKSRPDTLYKMSNGRILNQAELDLMVESSATHIQNMQEQQEQQQMQQMQQQMQQQGGEQQQPEGEMPGQGQPEPFAPMLTPPADAQQEPEQERQTLYDGDEPVRIEDKRPNKTYYVKHYKIAGDYVLDETEFPATQLPLVFVDQSSYYDKNGRQICRPFLIDARDAQRYINYLGTQSAYVLKVSRYDQWIGSKKNVSSNDTASQWRDPLSIQGMLTYDESPNGDKPQQIQPPELSQSLLTQYQRAIDDLYTSTGLYPTRMGDQGNEVSGAAIDARTRQGSYSTYTAFNSINRAICVGGEIVNEMIPVVYDAERVLALMTPDEGMKNITVNKEMDEYGERIENDIRKGTFQVRLMPGPSFEGQKQQALESLQQVLSANPESFPLVADLYAENLPLANTIELKNRFKTMVPPGIIEAGKTGKPVEQNGQPSPQEQAMQQQMQMQQQQMQMQQKEMELKEQELQLKIQQQQIDYQLAIAKLETEKLEVAGELEEQKLRYLAETERTQSDEAIAHANNLQSILTHKFDLVEKGLKKDD